MFRSGTTRRNKLPSYSRSDHAVRPWLARPDGRDWSEGLVSLVDELEIDRRDQKRHQFEQNLMRTFGLLASRFQFKYFLRECPRLARAFGFQIRVMWIEDGEILLQPRIGSRSLAGKESP